ncbi:beta-galactosidase-like protein [Pseudomonas sp. SJZ079]|uniref:beta-galactosidase n=1 Tax=Pseudomonas sp. SJZ079 TaxID=2572887 RepID=UPI00119C0859|nr:beta-galactosidase [Pseudomonas sp. SJZ079]TWC28286.1 beta-galactosidase-like protein [Pseudomonas sp. SJZ079]
MMCRALLVVALLFASPLFAAPAGQQTLFNFVSPTDVVQVTPRDASFPQLTGETTQAGELLRRLVFNAAERPSLRMTPQAGVWDWSKAGAMTLYLQNAMDWALTLNLRIESRDGKVLNSRIALPAGPAQVLLVPLQATSPKALGMRAGPPMPWRYEGQLVLLATTVEGELDASQVTAVTLSMDQPNVPQSILLGRFGVREGTAVQQAAYAGIVDAFGQFTRGHWPEKVSSVAQLQAAAAKEQLQLNKWLAERPEQDQFGGLLSGPSFEATGFFRTEQQDGRWYLVTPQGHGFFSLGVNAVTASQSQTYIEGRETMFSALPKLDEPLAAQYGSSDSRSNTGASKDRGFDHGRWFDFYRANLQRTQAEAGCSEPVKSTDGAQNTEETKAATTPEVITAADVAGETSAAQNAREPACADRPFDAERWTRQALDRLQAWGFNTVGNWSAPALGEAQRMPYTLPLFISGDYQTISTGLDWWGGMPDPFDPRFAMAAERAVAIATRDHRDDPWLLGYFADNELAWAHPEAGPRGRYALAYGTLRSTTDVPAKRAFLKQLRDKYRNQRGLSRAWGIELTAWELMEDPGFEAPLPSAEHPAIEVDFQRFQRLFADTYFKTITDALDWHAPNHLLLGGRFAISTPEAVASCAEYCDVLSFNFYTREPQQGYDFAALRALDKPVLISEFHFGSRDRGPFWGGVSEVAKEEQRGPAYAHFLKQALAEPAIVGAHWFQYLDQPVTGRLLDGENGHLGLLGITDRPFSGFIESVRKSNLALGTTLSSMAKASAAQAAAPANAEAQPAP